MFDFNLEYQQLEPRSEDFKYTLTDSDGTSDQATLTIKVKDTEPTANPDFNKVMEGAAQPIMGHVTENDDPGADGIHHISKIKHEGITYELLDGAVSARDEDGDVNDGFDFEDGILTIENTKLRGKLEINLTGENNEPIGKYTYFAPDDADHSAAPVTLTFTQDIVLPNDLVDGHPNIKIEAFNVDGSKGELTFTGNGDGLGVGNSDNIDLDPANLGNSAVPEQLNHTPDFGENGGSESIVISLLDGASGFSFTYTHAIQGEEGGEIGQWTALFADGTTLTRTFGNGSPDQDQDTNSPTTGEGQGTVIIPPEELDWKVVQSVTFSALPYADGPDARDNDSSDYFILDFTAEPAVTETFEYMIADGDWDMDTSVLTIKVKDSPVDQEPTAITFTPIEADENELGAIVASIEIDDIDTNYAPEDFVIGGPDAELFEIVDENGLKLKLKSDESLDYESENPPQVTVSLGDLASEPFTPNVGNIDEPATEIALAAIAVDENDPGAVVADVTVTDPDTTYTAANLTLSDDTFYELVDDGPSGVQLKLKDDVSLDFEGQIPTVTISLGDLASEPFTPNVGNIDEPATEIALAAIAVDENDPGAVVADVTVTDPDTTYTAANLTLSDDTFYELVDDGPSGVQLKLKDDVSLDFEGQIPTVTISLGDLASEPFTPNVGNIDEPATEIALAAIAVDENDPGAVVADVTVTDPDTTYTAANLTLSDDTFYELVDDGPSGVQLKLKDDVSLDFEGQIPTVTISLGDLASEPFTPNVGNIDEPATEIALAAIAVDENDPGAVVADVTVTDPDTTYTAANLTLSDDTFYELVDDGPSGVQLKLKDDVSLDFEGQIPTVTISLGDLASEPFTPNVGNIDEPATEIALAAIAVDENDPGAVVADVTVTDPDTTYTAANLTLSDDTFYELVDDGPSGVQLKLKDDVSLDFEGQIPTVTISLGDLASEPFTPNVGNIDEPATEIALAAIAVDENDPGAVVADVTVTDPDTTYTAANLTLSDDTFYELVDDGPSGVQLKLKDDVSLDFEGQIPTVTISLGDLASEPFTPNVGNIDEPATEIALAAIAVDENDPGAVVADVTVTDPDTTYTAANLTLSDDTFYELVDDGPSGVQLKLKDDVSLDFEGQIPTVTISLGDLASEPFTPNVGNIDEPATEIALAAIAVDENDPGAVVADVTVTDPDTTYTAANLTLSDDTFYELVDDGPSGVQLKLKDDVSLDFEGQIPTVTVSLGDLDSGPFTPQVNDVDEGDFETVYFQAEDGTITDATGASIPQDNNRTQVRDSDNPESNGNRPDFTGEGYVDFGFGGNAAGDRLSFDLPEGLVSGETYKITVRYASNSDRPLDLVFRNGESETSRNELPFNATDPDGSGPTEGFDNWDEQTFEFTYIAGDDTVSLEIAPGDNTGPNVDAIAISTLDGPVNFDAPDIEQTDFSVTENITEVGTITAIDLDQTNNVPDTLTYGIVDNGADDDGSLFSIDPSTGALSFQNAPDFEAPGDKDDNNVYEVEVSVSDGVDTTTAVVQVEVSDVSLENFDTVYLQGEDFAIIGPEVSGTVARTRNGNSENGANNGNSGPGLTFDDFGLRQDYTSIGYLDINGDQGEKASFEFDGPAGTYEVTIRLANGAGGSGNGFNRPILLRTNAGDSAPQNTNTGDWSNWQTRTFIIEVTGEGPHSVTVVQTTGNGAPNIDVVAIASPGTSIDFAPAVASPSTFEFTVDENTIEIGVIEANDAENQTLTFSIVPGAGDDLFTVDSQSGALSFVSAPDFETDPTSYSPTIEVFDGLNKSLQTITINVSNVDEPATEIALAAIAVDENDPVQLLPMSRSPTRTPPTPLPT